MFALVDAVEAYPQFLPWCSGTDVIHRDGERTRATLHVNYHGAKQSFTTENAKEAPQRMTVRLVRGPFRVLDGEWRFHAGHAGDEEGAPDFARPGLEVE